MAMFHRLLSLASILSACSTIGLSPAVAATRSPEPDRLGIPSDMAVIQQQYGPVQSAGPQFILIEDVHSAPEIQGKIAAIILYVHHHWNSRRTFIEGAFAPIGPPPFPIFTAERGELCANELLRRGWLSGGELAAALISRSTARPGAFEVIGVDDPALYRRQIETFEALAAVKDAAVRQLNKPGVVRGDDDRAWLTRLVELRLRPADAPRLAAYSRLRIRDPFVRSACDVAVTYYRLTDRRSLAFFERMLAQAAEGPAILVTGGFHTPAITRLLRRRNKSYVVLRPTSTQSMDANVYHDCMRTTSASLQHMAAPVASTHDELHLSRHHPTPSLWPAGAS